MVNVLINGKILLLRVNNSINGKQLLTANNFINGK